jgi:2-polyprenyl-3-methyl-5-hydroxy-6-metoxy-1,4-benzoquinol methylase
VDKPRRSSSPNLASIQTKFTDRSLLARFANRRFLETIRASVGGLEASSILDAGCGEGVVLELVTATTAIQPFGIDLDPERIQVAHGTRGIDRLAVADLQRLPFGDDTFDLVLLLEVLEHVGHPEFALDEIWRVTRRYLLASVPNEPWWSLGNMARLKYLSAWGNTPEHINHWSARGFKFFLASHFDVLELNTPVLWTFVLAEKRRAGSPKT